MYKLYLYFLTEIFNISKALCVFSDYNKRNNVSIWNWSTVDNVSRQNFIMHIQILRAFLICEPPNTSRRHAYIHDQADHAVEICSI